MLSLFPLRGKMAFPVFAQAIIFNLHVMILFENLAVVLVGSMDLDVEVQLFFRRSRSGVVGLWRSFRQTSTKDNIP